MVKKADSTDHSEISHVMLQSFLSELFKKPDYLWSEIICLDATKICVILGGFVPNK